MPKWAKIFLTCVVIIIAVWGTARVTGMLQYYKIPTPSSEPNIHQGQTIWVSNLKKPKRGDFVAYTSESMDSIENSLGISSSKNIHYLHRLCAIENDVIEMKNGIFFVNGKNFDTQLNLFHFYKVTKDAVAAFIRDENGQPGNPDLYMEASINDSFSVINLNTEDVKKMPADHRLEFYIFADTNNSTRPFTWYNNKSNWSANNFGPLTIPKGCGFVLGDNRDNSMDSRYTGFIKLSNIKGVKL